MIYDLEYRNYKLLQNLAYCLDLIVSGSTSNESERAVDATVTLDGGYECCNSGKQKAKKEIEYLTTTSNVAPKIEVKYIVGVSGIWRSFKTLDEKCV
jgi:hypothetical protein